MVKYAVSVSFGADPLKTEALEINQDADSEVHLAEQCPRGLNSAPIQNQASQLARRIAYYVGDVNRAKPASRIANAPGGSAQPRRGGHLQSVVPIPGH